MQLRVRAKQVKTRLITNYGKCTWLCYSSQTTSDRAGILCRV